MMSLSFCWILFDPSISLDSDRQNTICLFNDDEDAIRYAGVSGHSLRDWIRIRFSQHRPCFPLVSPSPVTPLSLSLSQSHYITHRDELYKCLCVGEIISISNFLIKSETFWTALWLRLHFFYLNLEIRGGNGGMDEAVNYQVMSAKDLVDSVFTQGGWSNILVCCSSYVYSVNVNLILLFWMFFFNFV